MASINKVTLIGNCGRDPEVRYAPSGSAICNVSIATSRSWKDKTTGERQTETEWHRVVFYDRLAEIAGEYLKKGKSIYVEGRLKTRKWTDKDGAEKYTTEIVAQEMTMLGSQNQDNGGAPAGEPSGAGSMPRAASSVARSGGNNTPQNTANQNKSSPQSSGNGFDDMSDDIPF